MEEGSNPIDGNNTDESVGKNRRRLNEVFSAVDRMREAGKRVRSSGERAEAHQCSSTGKAERIGFIKGANVLLQTDYAAER